MKQSQKIYPIDNIGFVDKVEESINTVFDIKVPEFLIKEFISFNGAYSLFYDDVKKEIEFYVPPILTPKKNFDSDLWKRMKSAAALYFCYTKKTYENYKTLIEMGVEEEQASSVLSQNYYVKIKWFGSPRVVRSFTNHILETSSSDEMKSYAEAIQKLLKVRINE